MFDSVFEKLQQEFKNQFSKSGEDAANQFSAAFDSLTKQMKKAFDQTLLNNFSKSTKNLSHVFFKNMEYMKSGVRYLKDQEDKLSSLSKKLSSEMAKINKLKQAEIDLHKLAYSAASKSGASIDVLLNLDEAHADKLDEINKAYASYNKMLGATQSMLTNNLIKQQLILNVIKQQSFLQYGNQRLNQAFGINGTSISNFFSRFNTFPKILLEVSILIGKIIKMLLEGYRELRKGGLDALQSVSAMGSVIADQWKGATRGILASTKEFAANYAALSNSIGSLNVPDELVVDATRLSTQFGLSKDEASGLTGEMARLSQWSAKAVTDSQKLARAMAAANNIGIGTMMKDVSRNAELLGNYAGRGFEAFYKSLIAARQYGVELKTISGFADNLVNDFESAIMMQARLQTINPSLDLSETMYASQFGSDEQVADSLHNALNSAGYQNLGTLPRSIRNMIASSLGMSVNDLTNLMAGKKEPGEVRPGDPDFHDATRAFANSIGDLITSNKTLVNVISALTGALLLNSLSRLGGGLGGLGKLGASLGGAAGLAKGFGALGGVAALGMTGFDLADTIGGPKGSTLHALNRNKGTLAGAGIGTAIVPGIGTLIGAGIGGLADWIINSITGEPASASGNSATVPQSTVSSLVKNSTLAQESTEDHNTKVEELLKQLIKEVKNGSRLFIDGRELGKVMRDGHIGVV